MFRLCFHCGDAEWQREVIEFERTLDEDDRYADFLLS